ncbi:hypothetical protein AAG747_28235 [Rapidithrix thailandica]|uniref:Transcriptional regulator n=1 Tax=Rapidithrix thailandica TaxID=413964 RepID=A0AAW9SL30_9BACT
MNFIRHFNAVVEKLSADERLHNTHVSLYFALFALWNRHRFQNPLSVNRSELMTLSKIGSKNTYHKCMKALDAYGYLHYQPSRSALKGSRVYMQEFTNTLKQTQEETGYKNGTSTKYKSGTGLGQVCPTTGTSSGQVLGPYINKKNNTNVKHSLKENLLVSELGRVSSFRPPGEEEVTAFFLEQGQMKREGLKFYHYFQSVGWVVGKAKPMKDWKAAAQHWILQAKQTGRPSYLEVNLDKNYHEPL